MLISHAGLCICNTSSCSIISCKGGSVETYVSMSNSTRSIRSQNHAAPEHPNSRSYSPLA